MLYFFPSCLPEVKAPLYTLEIQLQHKSDGFLGQNDDPIPNQHKVFWYDFTAVMGLLRHAISPYLFGSLLCSIKFLKI